MENRDKKNDTNGREEEADVMLVKATFAPEDEKLSQMTRLSANLPLPLAMVEMMETATRNIAARIESKGARDPDQSLLSTVFRLSLYKHRRSLNADLLLHGIMLAQDQIAASMEDGDKFIDPKEL